MEDTHTHTQHTHNTHTTHTQHTHTHTHTHTLSLPLSLLQGMDAASAFDVVKRGRPQAYPNAGKNSQMSALESVSMVHLVAGWLFGISAQAFKSRLRDTKEWFAVRLLRVKNSWVMSRVYESRHMYEWVMAHVWRNVSPSGFCGWCIHESCHTYA